MVLNWHTLKLENSEWMFGKTNSELFISVFISISVIDRIEITKPSEQKMKRLFLDVLRDGWLKYENKRP